MIEKGRRTTADIVEGNRPGDAHQLRFFAVVVTSLDCGRQLHLSRDGRVVARVDAETAIGDEIGDLRVWHGRVIDGGQGRTADLVHGHHAALVTATVGHGGGDTAQQRGLDEDATCGIDDRIEQSGRRAGGGQPTQRLARGRHAQQGIDRLRQDVLRLPADGVEGQCDGDSVAGGRDRVVCCRTEGRRVVCLDGDIAKARGIGRRHRAVDDFGPGPTAHRVGTDQPTGGDSIAAVVAETDVTETGGDTLNRRLDIDG